MSLFCCHMCSGRRRAGRPAFFFILLLKFHNSLNGLANQSHANKFVHDAQQQKTPQQQQQGRVGWASWLLHPLDLVHCPTGGGTCMRVCRLTGDM